MVQGVAQVRPHLYPISALIFDFSRSMYIDNVYIAILEAGDVSSDCEPYGGPEGRAAS
jgi:hypothetical protein